MVTVYNSGMESKKPWITIYEKAKGVQNCYGYVAERLGYEDPQVLMWGISEEEQNEKFRPSSSFDSNTLFIQIFSETGKSCHMVFVDRSGGRGYQLMHKRNLGFPEEETSFEDLETTYPRAEYEYVFFARK